MRPRPRALPAELCVGTAFRQGIGTMSRARRLHVPVPEVPRTDLYHNLCPWHRVQKHVLILC